MSYRFVRVTDYYPLSIESYSGQYEDFARGKSAADQYEYLISKGWESSNYISEAFRKKGVEAFELISNADPLMRAWSQENGSSDDLRQILVDQIKALAPEVLYFQNGIYYGGKWLDHVRKNVPSVKLILGWCCTLYRDSDIVRLSKYDAILTCTPGYVEDLKNLGLNTHLFNYGFEKSLLRGLETNDKEDGSHVIFAGSLFRGNKFQPRHNERISYLDHMLQAGIKLKIYGNLSREIKGWRIFAWQVTYRVYHVMQRIGLKSLADRMPLIGRVKTWLDYPEKLTYPKKITGIVRKPLFGADMIHAMSLAKITFNIHGAGAKKYAGNVRLFEATGAGSCLVTDNKKNLKELFELNKEVATYDSMEECVEKIRYLLKNEEERSRIAKAGQDRTLRDHTYDNRVEDLGAVITKLLSGE